MNTSIVATFRLSRWFRVVTCLAIAGQVVTAAPVLAQDAGRAMIRDAKRAAVQAKRKLDKARVRVNRTVPTVASASLDPMFGVNVTTDMLRRARVFHERLIPTGKPTVAENQAVARLLEQVAIAPAERRLALIDAYLTDAGPSPWRASVLSNAGILYDHEGYFSRAAAYWGQAWELTRDSDDRQIRTLADDALAQSVTQMVKFGQVARLEARLKEAEGRDVRGESGAKVADARMGLAMLREKHETATFSGPEALKMYLTVRPVSNVEQAVRTIAAYHPRVEGTSIRELRELASSAELSMDVWTASTVAEFPIPSVVHLRSQHFSAVVEYRDRQYRLRDPVLGGDVWVREDALREEASGYVLTPSRPAGDEWRKATDEEASTIVGHCNPGKPEQNDPPPDNPECGDSGPGGPEPPCPTGGMPAYRFHPSAASLLIEDMPLFYSPAVGPRVEFRLSYSHRGGKHPTTYGYGNVGNLWTFNQLSYVIDNMSMVAPPYETAFVYLRGFGREEHNALEAVHPISQSELIKVADDPPQYERHAVDGTVEVFTLADRAASLPGRRIFLTEVIDPQGLSLEYTYDSNFRLVAVEDALGQVTTFEYEDASDEDLLTKVTDPFGRVATVGYDTLGRIVSITDVIGMTSTFSYGQSDFINAMTTPYGTTTFRFQSLGVFYNWRLRLDATDPTGGRERLEFIQQSNAFAGTADSGEVPTGFTASNEQLDYWNSFYWDKQAMALYADDYSKAVNYNWMQAMDVDYGHLSSRAVMHSVKRPLENRVWFRYPGQSSSEDHELASGSGSKPALVGRVLDGGASQVSQFTYNSKGNVTSYTDPVVRQTTSSYATNGLDLLEVRQGVSGGTDLLVEYSDYTTQHRPQTVADSAGNETAIAYNSFAQPLTITNAKSEVTTLAYETDTQNLLTVTGAVSGSTTTYTYDAYNRVDSITASDGYSVLIAYDALNRMTELTYPDDTTETFTYDKLHLAESKDRLGRVTRHLHDGQGRLTATRDPAGRATALVWCACGVLDALVDAKGQRTTWERDINGRVTRELRADGATDTHYTYDLAGRLKTVTDPLDQVTTYTYNVDNSLASTGFTNETIATPDISHTYDTYYARPATTVDGNGTTTYSYVAAGTNGAGHVASVNGPFSNDTISYTYDELGRVLTRMLNGTGTEITYDVLGRLSQLEFPIGAFDYTYVGHTGRRSAVTYPNSQTTTYSYLDDEHDFRLQTIHHKNPSAATLSKFDYTYDTVGNIQTWRQERAGSAAKIYTFTHDMIDQLTSAVLTDTNTTPTILKRQAWAYDPAGNRTIDQNDDAVFATTHDSLNRLGSRAPGGPIVFSGSLNEAGTVTIDGQPADVDAANNFRGTANLTSATTTVTLKAKDASGNETTQQYEVDASGSTTSYTYDANGNLTSDGTKTYFWNALNQLVEVKEGTTTIATFEYDGDGRRTEKVAAGLTHQYIYDAEDIVEERITGSSSDTIRYYHGAGIDEPLARKNSSDVVTYYLADHLGSIVQESSAAGAITLEREYDPWGVASQGASTSGYAFTGREWDSEIAHYYYRARYYDASSGRFLGEDPIRTSGSLFSYVANAPVVHTDPTGQFIWVLPFVPAAVTALEAALVATTVVLASLAAGDALGDIIFSDKADDAEDYDGFINPKAPTKAKDFKPLTHDPADAPTPEETLEDITNAHTKRRPHVERIDKSKQRADPNKSRSTIAPPGSSTSSGKKSCP